MVFIYDEKSERVFDEDKQANLVWKHMKGNLTSYEFTMSPRNRIRFLAENNISRSEDNEWVMTCDVIKVEGMPADSSSRQIHDLIVDALLERKWGRKTDDKNMRLVINSELLLDALE